MICRKVPSFQALAVIVLGVLLRCIYVTAPLVDLASWRETQTAMITRNLVHQGFDIFHPTIDWFGNSVAYLALEFPLYNLVVGIFYAVFGEHEFFGRLVSILFSGGTLVLFYLLARMLQDEKSALFSLLCFVLCPLSIFYGQTYMPESLMLFLSVGAIYFLLEWANTDRRGWFLLSVVFAACAFLVKTPVTIQLFIPLLYIFWRKHGRSVLAKKDFYLFFLIAYVPILAWVIYSQALTRPSFPGESFEKFVGNLEPRFHIESYLRIGGFVLVYLLTPVGALFLTSGLFSRRLTSLERLLLAWFSSTVLYLLVFFPALEGHHYYLLPLIPCISLYIGKGIQLSREYFHKRHIRRIFRLGAACILMIATLGFIGLPLFHLSKQDTVILHAADAVRSHTKPSDLVLTATFHAKKNAFGNPALLYYCQRKGWIELYPYDINRLLSTVSRYKNKGAAYLIVTYTQRYTERSFLERFSSHKPDFDGPKIITELSNHFSVVESGRDFVLYQL